MATYSIVEVLKLLERPGDIENALLAHPKYHPTAENILNHPFTLRSVRSNEREWIEKVSGELEWSGTLYDYIKVTVPENLRGNVKIK